MALDVDLYGMADDGSVAWRWHGWGWNGFDVLDLVKPAPSDPWPASWEGPITRAQLETLREKAGGKAHEAENIGRRLGWDAEPQRNLDELLVLPVARIDVRVEEWGSE